MTLWAERVTTHLYVEHRRIGSPRLKRFGFEALAADGTHVDCPRTRANEKGCGVWGREGSRPQLCMTVLWHMGTGLPAAWRIGRAETSERELLLSMLDVLEPGQLLVADAGFVGYDLLSRLTGEGIQVLIRVGSNVRLLTGLGWSVQEHNGRVYLWPQERRDRPPLTLRLVRVKRPGKADVCLLTSVLEPTRLSDEHAAALYRMRWGIEMFFRHAKQTLARRKMCSAAPAQAKVELHWTMVGLLVLGLLGVRRLIAAGRDPLGLSMAAVLKAVRAAAGGTLDRRGLDRALGHALKEDRQRASEKTSRNWPHKRSQRPPGEPKLRPATPQEIEAAKQLALKTAA
jgi:hypothetical protein